MNTVTLTGLVGCHDLELGQITALIAHFLLRSSCEALEGQLTARDYLLLWKISRSFPHRQKMLPPFYHQRQGPYSG